MLDCTFDLVEEEEGVWSFFSPPFFLTQLTAIYRVLLK
jgi:hypothetical protein